MSRIVITRDIRRVTACLLLGILQQLPSAATATHQGLEQLGLESTHVDACVGFISAGCSVGFFGTEINPAAVFDEQDVLTPYAGSTTASASQDAGEARFTVLFSAGTFPVIQLHAENGASSPLQFSASQASAYWQDEITITVPSLPPGAQVFLVPSSTVSGELVTTEEGLGGAVPPIATYQVLAGRLNEGLNMELAVDGRFWADVFCTLDDSLACGVFSQNYGGPTGLPIAGIPFFNGDAGTFRFIVRASASSSAAAALGTSIHWIGASVQNAQGGLLQAVITSGAGIDYTVPSAVPDRDSDGIADGADVCPDWASATQNDADENGIGDECECGDQTGDGIVDILDILAINDVIFELQPASPLCDTNDDGLCNVEDSLGVNAKIFGAPAYCARFPAPSTPQASRRGPRRGRGLPLENQRACGQRDDRPEWNFRHRSADLSAGRLLRERWRPCHRASHGSGHSRYTLLRGVSSLAAVARGR